MPSTAPLTATSSSQDLPLQVAFAWAASIEPEDGAQLLIKLGLLDTAIDFALESGAFAQAFLLCQVVAAQHKMPDCHLKFAMYLEDEGALPCICPWAALKLPLTCPCLPDHLPMTWS